MVGVENRAWLPSLRWPNGGRGCSRLVVGGGRGKEVAADGPRRDVM